MRSVLWKPFILQCTIEWDVLVRDETATSPKQNQIKVHQYCMREWNLKYIVSVLSNPIYNEGQWKQPLKSWSFLEERHLKIEFPWKGVYKRTEIWHKHRQALSFHFQLSKRRSDTREFGHSELQENGGSLGSPNLKTRVRILRNTNVSGNVSRRFWSPCRNHLIRKSTSEPKEAEGCMLTQVLWILEYTKIKSD